MNTLSRIVRVASALGLLLAVVLLFGCAESADVDPENRQLASSAPVAAAPTVKLIMPAAGATVPAGTVRVAVETTGLEFVMPSGTNVAGQGHVHFTLDDRPFVMSIEKGAELEDVEPGIHRLIVELVQNDTDSFDPPIKQELEFVVE